MLLCEKSVAERYLPIIFPLRVQRLRSSRGISDPGLSALAENYPLLTSLPGEVGGQGSLQERSEFKYVQNIPCSCRDEDEGRRTCVDLGLVVSK